MASVKEFFSPFLLTIWKTAKEQGGGQRRCLMSLTLPLVKKGVPILLMFFSSKVYWAGPTGFTWFVK